MWARAVICQVDSALRQSANVFLFDHGRFHDRKISLKNVSGGTLAGLLYLQLFLLPSMLAQTPACAYRCSFKLETSNLVYLKALSLLRPAVTVDDVMPVGAVFQVQFGPRALTSDSLLPIDQFGTSLPRLIVDGLADSRRRNFPQRCEAMGAVIVHADWDWTKALAHVNARLSISRDDLVKLNNNKKNDTKQSEETP